MAQIQLVTKQMETDGWITEYDKPIDKLFPNSISKILFLTPKIVKGNMLYDIPCHLNIVTDCSLVFLNNKLPKGTIIVSIILDGIIIDKFRTDQSEIYEQLRNKYKYSANVIPNTILHLPLKTFFNKYPENFLPTYKLYSAIICVENPNLISIDQIKLMVHTQQLDKIMAPDIMKYDPIQKMIEQHGTYVHRLNYGWIEFRESYNILRTTVRHKVFRTKQLVNHIMSFLKPITPLPLVKEQIKIILNCNGPIKEMYWFAKCDDKIVKMFGNQRLLFNGYPRQKGNAAYFEYITTLQYYNNNISNVSVYPFVINPTSFDSIGNFLANGIDEIILELDLEYCGRNKYDIVVCWTNSNVIRYSCGHTCTAYNF